MISQMAKGDYEDLLAAGLPATLEDFDRLNSIALRLTDGEETTPANFPRIGWAGDIPFHQPTIQALAWYLRYAERIDADAETKNTFWWFALAHGRTAHAFDDLTTPDAIRERVADWAATLNVSRDEVCRACKLAVHGYDDAVAAKGDGAKPNSSDVVASRLTRKLAELIGLVGMTQAEAEKLSGDEADLIISKTYERLGKTYGVELRRLRADYDLTLRDIRRRLRAEKELQHGN